MKWNKESFSIYKSDEKTVLGLLKELGKTVNELGVYVDDTYKNIESEVIDYIGKNYNDETMKELINSALFTDLNKQIKDRFINCYSYLDIIKAIEKGQNIYIPKFVELEINTHIEVNTPITIINEGKITQTKNKSCIFLVTTDNVKIIGGKYYGTEGATDLLPQSYGSAVILYKVKNCLISNLSIFGCSKKYGIDSGSGIYLTGAKNNRVENCYIEGCYHGINTDSVFNGTTSENNKIRFNHIVDCKFGYVLDLQGNDYSSHIGDVFSYNVVEKSIENSIQVDDCNKNFTIENNLVKESGKNGIVIMNRTSQGVIKNNFVTKSKECGIVLNHITTGHLISNVVIENNTFRYNNTDGMQLYNVTGIEIRGNKFMNNKGCGIASFPGCYPAKIKIFSNNISWNEGVGISLCDCKWIDIFFNDIFKNSVESPNSYSGILIDRSSGTPTMITINNNKFLDEGEETQKYGIEIKSNINNFIVACCNHLENQKTGAIYDPTNAVKLWANKGVADK